MMSMATLAPPPFVPVHPHRPRTLPPVWAGFFGERLRNSVYGWTEAAFEMPIFTRRIMGFTVHFVNDPAAIERVLLTNKPNYLRPGIARRLLAPLLGRGLLSAEGEDWRVQRKLVAHSFAPAAVDRLATVFDACAADTMTRWPQAGGRVDLAAAATDTTMRIIAAALFGGDPALVTPLAARHIETLVMSGGQARLSALLGVQDWDFSPTMRKARASQAWLRATLTDLVDRRGVAGGGDSFGELIRGLREHYPPDEARTLAIDNAVTFYVAGHETTANAIAWTLYCLAAQPALQAQVRAEAAVANRSDPDARYDALPLLRQVLEESLRLYPPAPRFDREAQAGDMLGDVAIERGNLVSIWPWVVHRHRLWWDDPDSFDHRRFAPERRGAIRRFQYIPFGGGPRVCVGQRFAMVEAALILSRWIERWRIALPPGWQPDPAGGVTLRPRGGMPLIVHPA